MDMYDLSHPGRLIADILENGELKIGNSIVALAEHLRMAEEDLSRVVEGESSVSADLALLLEDALGVKADLWLRLQNKRDLWRASQNRRSTVTKVESKAA